MKCGVWLAQHRKKQGKKLIQKRCHYNFGLTTENINLSFNIDFCNLYDYIKEKSAIEWE